MKQNDLLEREQELDTLAERIFAACSGSGGMVLLEASAGIGKSRLLSEAKATAEAAGMKVLFGQGVELEKEFAFGIVRQLFEPALASTRTEPSNLLLGAAAPAAAVFEPVTTAIPSGDFATLHGLYWLTINMAQTAPLVLMIDDVQWSDEASLRFLSYLVPRLDVLPVLLVTATRPRAEEKAAPLLEALATDPSIVELKPGPLSRQASATLVAAALSPDMQAEESFLSACYDATAGNPLLLKQLVQVVVTEKISATGENASRILELGPRAIARYVSVRFNELPPDARKLAQSVAVLGDGAELGLVAAHAQISIKTAAQMVDMLQRVNIFWSRPSPSLLAKKVHFVHGLVRTAVYGELTPDVLMDSHARAAELLTAADADIEHVAAHALNTLPSGNDQTVHILRSAATGALSRGSPESARAYLRRCLEEPPSSKKDRLDVLIEAGTCSQLFDLDGAVAHLKEALTLSVDAAQRAQIRTVLGGALLWLHRTNEAHEMYETGLTDAPDEDARRELLAGLLSLLFIDPNRPELIKSIDEIERMEHRDSLGARELDAMLGYIRAHQGNPVAIDHSRRALSDGRLLQLTGGEIYLPMGGWLPLIAADRTEVLASLNEAVANAHERGVIRAMAPAYDMRGSSWLCQGYLADAQADFTQAMHALNAAGIAIGKPYNGSHRAQAFMSQGRLDEAEKALKWTGVRSADEPGLTYFVTAAKARLLRLRQHYELALSTALQAGRRFEMHGGCNPAIIPWRSEAALCLLALNRIDEARQYAAEEVYLAYEWKAPRAIGRALRVSGLAEGGSAGLELLREAVHTLADSPARLEYAAALVELSSALRRAGQRVPRDKLHRGIELAEICTATPLVQRGLAELKTIGGRLDRVRPTGRQSLTPSELRVAELIASGASNREIAQCLFITVKTVDIHLGDIYRKLNVTCRDEVSTRLLGLDTEPLHLGH
ncbi:helix-turn-helix transcriptional regulator [Streptomyces chartreusis]|uniref:helix-turn-helix transcriptional regulator n=1 Tax=Streptomyces chartreusis TaxID=1969 RepID=UPI0036CCBE9E